jgi:hypothetical protein
MYLCVTVTNLPLSTILQLNFEFVPLVYFFLFFLRHVRVLRITNEFRFNLYFMYTLIVASPN